MSETEKNPNYYNKEKLYDKEISSHVQSIKKICALNRIPCFICVAVANNDKKTKYEYDGVLTGYLGLELTQDLFAKHLCIANGFDVRAINAVNDFESVQNFLSEEPIPESITEEIKEE